MQVRLHVPRRYKPREQFSPSGLDTLDRCGAAWFKRYVEGIKEGDLANWWEVQHIDRPEEPIKGAAEIAWAQYREEVQEYKRLTRRALGQAIHHCLQVWYDWHPPLIDVWSDESWARPCAVAMAGLEYMPVREELDLILIEEEWRLPFGTDDRDPFDVFGFIDLVVRFRTGRHKLIDYKSTGNLDWAPTPDEMLTDVQACDYALGVMVEFDLPEIECLWIYFLTDEKKKPEAWPVEFTITREQAVNVMAAHEERAELAREAMRAHVAGDRSARTLPVVSKNAMACGDFGGCVYHHERGNGGCRPPRLTTGQQLQLDKDKKRLLEKRRQYRRAVLAGEHGPRPSRRQQRAQLSAPHERKKESTRTMAERKSMSERLKAIQNGEDDATEGGGSDGGGGTQASGRGRGSRSSSDSSGSARSGSGGGASSGRGGTKPKEKPASNISVYLVVKDGDEEILSVRTPSESSLEKAGLAVATALLG